MDTPAAQWPQDIMVKDMVTTSGPPPERKIRPQKDQALNCPRCHSTNTKFCYYNNYSLSQPRYFCKTCRRYWTEGGSLRNIPVGGGSRKNKRPSSSKKLPDLVPQNPNKIILDPPQDLNLEFSAPHQDFKAITEMIQVPNFTKLELQNPSISTSSSSLGLLNSFMPPPPPPSTTVYSSSPFNIPLHSQFKPSLNFSLDGLGNNYGNFQSLQETTNGKLLFPFEDLKQQQQQQQISTTDTSVSDQHNREQGDSTGYWTGVISGGQW